MLCYVYYLLSDKENFLVLFILYVYMYGYVAAIVSHFDRVVEPAYTRMLKLRHGYFYNATIVKRHWYFIYVNKRQFCTPEISRQFYEREMLRV